ncbi:MAG TPA: hypothetical protein VFI62_07260 [Burkholderiales bacterium]|nr:hypothetical protein [Burkholderiales bacterium]
MQPAQLAPEHFAGYPPLARQVAIDGLDVLRDLPLSFVPLLLAEVIAYDSKFPAERQEVDAQFVYVRSLSPTQRSQLMAGFERLVLAPELQDVDWVNTPGEFSERLSAHLWTSQQIATFRTAAVEFLNAVRAQIPPPVPDVPRLSLVILGQGVAKNTYPLFRKLRPHGTYFTQVDPQDGLRIATERAAARAQKHPIPFGHWYIDGGTPASPVPSGLEMLAYPQLDAVRDAVVAKMRATMRAGLGTEARRSALMQMVPEDAGLKSEGDQRVFNHFKITVMSEGAGVQFFSTTFVQWAAREVLRRAQPVTLLARFAPRMTERSMNDALMNAQSSPVLDPQGALVDADMGAYYTWLNQARLTGADESCFVVWFENHSEALAISPSMPRGTQSSVRMDLNELLDKVSG